MTGSPAELCYDVNIDGKHWCVHVAYEAAADAQGIHNMTADQFEEWMQANEEMLTQVAVAKVLREGITGSDVTIVSTDLV